MRLLCVVSAILYAVLFIQPGYSQAIRDYVAVQDPPSWVLVSQIDQSPFDLGKDEPIDHLLVDNQTLVDRNQEHIFFHSAKRLKTPAAVEDYSTIAVNFDPEFRRVEIHRLRILRGSQTRDLLELSEFDLYRTETERDRLIYNGMLQLSYLISDLRVGDIVEFSYSIVGKNPAIGPHSSVVVTHQYGVPARQIRNRVLVAQGYPVHLKNFAEAPAAQRGTLDGYDVYSWQEEDVPGTASESNQPIDHFNYARTIFSSFESWAEVGQYFAPFYAVGEDKPAEIIKLAKSIKAEHKTDSARLRAALAFVQRDIRYLGIELGAGGYIPRSAHQVLANRFGDCKDMVVLLITLLDELGIDAKPLLVDFRWRGSIDVLAPMYGAFDHVIVVAEVDGKRYFLDPTRGDQLGDLDHLGQGNFGKGVIIAPDSPGMVDANAPVPDFFKVIKDRFITLPGEDDVRFINTSEYYMGDADSMNAWRQTSGMEEVEKAFLKYYQKQFTGLTQTEPLKVEVIEDQALIRFVASYRIQDAWSRSEEELSARTFWVKPYDILSDVPDFDGSQRQTAYAIDHPRRTRHEIEVVLDDTWIIDDRTESYAHPAFSYDIEQRFRNGRLHTSYTYITKSDRIEPEDFKASMASLAAIDEDGIYLTETLAMADANCGANKTATCVADKVPPLDAERIRTALKGSLEFSSQFSKCLDGNQRSCAIVGNELAFGHHVQADGELAVTLLGPSCDAGFESVCAHVGEYLLKNSLDTTEPALIDELYIRSCLANPDYCYSAASLYLERSIFHPAPAAFPEDYERAAEILSHGCENGSGSSCFLLAQQHQKGTAPDSDPATELALLKKACEYNSAEGCYDLGRRYRGDGSENLDWDLALEYFQKSCDLNYSFGCTNVAFLYDDQNFPLKADAEKRFSFVKKGCDLGDPGGCIVLAGLKLENAVFGPDPVQEFKTSKRKCEQGSPEACSSLGQHYEFGDGVEKNGKLAFEAYQFACENGYGAGCNGWGNIYAKGIAGEQDDFRAVELFEQACQLGDPIGCTNVAYFAEQRRGAFRLNREILEHYQRGCDGGFDHACKRLAELRSE
ncbi:DUF3857 domain-containing protein [Roseovarius sp. CAU 1744]|uniref:DUF3857 domain-containing protein n=1 Tax=Roseovarius sp. CAU 1744 TaxID=3140368 RepID=UPI00325B7F90